MSHFLETARNEVVGSILFIHLLPLLELFPTEEIFFRRIVGLIMSG